MRALTKTLLSLGASSVVAISGGYLVGPYEGKRNTAYLDMVGIPTVCWGQTKGVKLGQYFTDEQCDKKLAEELTTYNRQMMSYVKRDIPDNMEIAFTSFVWNVGIGAWKNSTALKKVNEGDFSGACSQLLRWNKATFTSNAARKAQEVRGEVCTALQGGRWSCTVKGLTNRREAEYKVCMGNNPDVTEAITKLNKEGWKNIALDIGE